MEQNENRANQHVQLFLHFRRYCLVNQLTLDTFIKLNRLSLANITGKIWFSE